MGMPVKEDGETTFYVMGDRAKRRISRMEAASPTRVAMTDTAIAQLMKWL